MIETPSHPSTSSVNDALRARHSNRRTPRNKRLIAMLSVLLVLLVCGALGGAGYVWHQNQQLQKAAAEATQAPIPETELPVVTEEPVDNRVDNPIDFNTLKAENPDIYAWIYVPNTNVNYPVLQSTVDDNYYLQYNRYHEQSVEGAIFSQSMNTTDFSDPVTVLYGHNNNAGAMFNTLHYFENEDFFNSNDTFYIYIPGHILTYRIVAANQYDNRHILNSFNFTNQTVLQDYYNSVLNPTALVANVREGITLTTTNKIVQLSTCTGDSNRLTMRYLVTGVMVDDQETR